MDAKEMEMLADMIGERVERAVTSSLEKVVKQISENPATTKLVEALNANAEGSTLLATRLMEYIEHQFHTVR